MAKIVDIAEYRRPDVEQASEPLSWSELVRMEPTLDTLERHAKDVCGDNPHFCANDVWFREFKPLLLRLVGWNAQSPLEIMHSSAAYEIAYRHIYDQLPPCRECWCA